MVKDFVHFWESCFLWGDCFCVFRKGGAGQKAKWGLPGFLQLLYKDFIPYVKAESSQPLSPFNNPPFNAIAEGTEFQFTSGGAQMFRYGIPTSYFPQESQAVSLGGRIS